MRICRLWSRLLVLAMWAVFANPLVGQQPDDEKAAQDLMMQAMKEMSAPGEFHNHLKPLAGRWTQVAKLRFSEDTPWDESAGISEYKWILGGRFLVQTVEGEAKEGEKFEGYGLMGYDTPRKQYSSVWADNMGTGTMISYGTCDASGKVITMKGEYADPMTGQTKKDKSVLRILGNDKHVYEMYTTGPDGKEFKSLEVTYSRKK